MPIFYRRIGILWGLKDFNLFRKWFNSLSRKDKLIINSSNAQNNNKGYNNLLRSFLITEDEDALLGLSKFLLCIPKLLFANLLLLVCKKENT